MDTSNLSHVPVLGSRNKNKNCRILVVEDEIVLADALALGLKNAGYKTKVARNGNDAILIAKKYQPHLILLDILLPGKNGFDVLNELKKNNPDEFPVIILTNLDDDSDKQKGAALGAYDYMVKSQYTLSDIIKKIEKFFKEKGKECS